MERGPRATLMIERVLQSLMIMMRDWRPALP